MHARKQASDDPIDLISGTLGISGAVDNILVMYKRKGNRAQLWVQGRDVDQEEYTIEYSPNIWTWQMLGESSKVMASDKQQTVLDCLILNTKVTQSNLDDGVTLSLREIIELTKVNKDYLKVKILPKLLKTGLIAKSGRDQYYAIGGVCKNS